MPEAIYPLSATAKGFGEWWAANVTEPQGAVELGFFNRTAIYPKNGSCQRRSLPFACRYRACEQSGSHPNGEAAEQLEATTGGEEWMSQETGGKTAGVTQTVKLRSS